MNEKKDRKSPLSLFEALRPKEGAPAPESAPDDAPTAESHAPAADSYAPAAEAPCVPEADSASDDPSESESLRREISRLREEAAAREAAFLAEKEAWETERRLAGLSAKLLEAGLPQELTPLVDHADPAVSQRSIEAIRETVEKAVKAALRRAAGGGVPRGDGERGLTREEVRALPLAALEARMGR